MDKLELNIAEISKSSETSETQLSTLERDLLQLREYQLEYHDLSLEKIACCKQSKDVILQYTNRLDDDMKLFETELTPEAILAAQIEDTSITPKKKVTTTTGPIPPSSNIPTDKKKSIKTATSNMKNDRLEREYDLDYAEDTDDMSGTDDTGPTASGGDEMLNAEFMAAKAAKALDPNEPLFCICQQPSYGDMVACDNDGVTNNKLYMLSYRIKPPHSHAIILSFSEGCQSVLQSS